MENKKVYSNIILNTINSILKVIFPLISFKYAAVILGQESIGKVNYGTSIINYFVLLAGLGISTYAIREGAKIRDSKEKIKKFLSEIFTINLVSTIISYLFLLICIFFINDLKNISILLLVQSSLILFTTLSVEWIYSIYEDYGFIAIRNFILQIVSLILMFVFVKDEGDYMIFAGIQVFSSSGAFIINYLHINKRVPIKIAFSRTLKKHLKPIMILFVNNIAVVIYVNSDTTMIGNIIGMSAVGIYSSSVRIYTMFKTVISAVVISVLPNISRYSSDEFLERKNKIITDTIEVIILLIVPMIISTILIGKELIILTTSTAYLGGYLPLVVLSISLIFSTSSTILTTFYLIPLKLENYALMSTIFAAIINIVLNMFMLSRFGIIAAAFTTMVAELVVTLISIVVIKKMKIRFFSLIYVLKIIVKEIIVCIPLIIIYFVISSVTGNVLIILGLYGIFGVIIYLVMNCILKISVIRSLLNNVLNWRRK